MDQHFKDFIKLKEFLLKLCLSSAAMILVSQSAAAAPESSGADTFSVEPGTYKWGLSTDPALLTNAFPLVGGKGFALGGEYRFSPSLAVTTECAYSVHNLKQINAIGNDRDAEGSIDDPKITLRTSRVFGGNIGPRYFFRPRSTWFVGSQLKYQREQTSFDYGGAAARVYTTTIGPTAGGGYRWQWRHGGFIEWVGGAYVRLYSKEKISWESEDQSLTDKGEKKFHDSLLFFGADRVVLPEWNISMGYLFR